MGRWASVFLLLALAAVSGRHAQPTCPVPSTSLMRQDDGRCSSDAVPPPMPQQPLPAAKEPKLPSFEEWKQDHVEEPVPRPLNPKATSAAVEEEVTHATRASADITDSAVLPAQPPRTRPADVEQAPAAVETPSALATTSYVHPQPNAGTGMTGDPLLPLKSRTNYASNDCAAVVLRSSKASKHASSILTSAKDRYMLTPCAADNKFVVVELCDEIDIDTVVLANWEFFSSMFKLFRASVSEVYPGRDEDWRELGTFRAGNLRGSQVFRPPHLGGFYRYIRIDFLTHYGTEYYCPVSLVQIYGRTQMEAYREEERAREEALRRLASIERAEGEAIEGEVVPPIVAYEPVNGSPTASISVEKGIEDDETTEATPTVPIIDVLSSKSAAEFLTSAATGSALPVTPSLGAASHTTMRPTSVASPVSEASSVIPDPVVAVSPGTEADPTETLSSTATSAFMPSLDPSLAVHNATSTKPTSSAPAGSTSSSARVGKESVASRAAGNSTVVSRASSEASPAPRPREDARQPPPLHAPSREGGESIYGTIMKRLSALEYNSTLAMRYLDDQRRVVGSSIAKLERQITAGDTLRQQDSQLIRRLILDFDLHRAKIEEERRALAAQVTVLANEIVFERRLGLAQLLALLVVLGFVVLTRGSYTPLVRLPAQRARPYAAALTGREDLSRRTPGPQTASRRLHTSLGPNDRPANLLPRRNGSLRRRENASTPTSASTSHLPRPRIASPFPSGTANGHTLALPDRRRRSLTPPLTAPLLPSLKIPPSPLSDRWLSTSGSESEASASPDEEADVGTPRSAYEMPTPRPTPSPPSTPTSSAQPGAPRPALADADDGARASDASV